MQKRVLSLLVDNTAGVTTTSIWIVQPSEAITSTALPEV